MTITTYHYDLLRALVIKELILAVKFIFIIKLELHPRPNERVLPSLLLQPLLKINPPIHLWFQIRYQQLSLPCLLEYPHIEGNNIMLQLQIVLLPLIEPPKNKDLPLVLIRTRTNPRCDFILHHQW